MFKILVTKHFKLSQRLEVLFSSFDVEYINELEEYKGKKEEVYGVIGYRFFEFNDIQSYINLKFIQLTSMGVNTVDVDYVKNKKISLCNAKDAYAIPIAEYVVGAMLSFYRGLFDFKDLQRQKVWKMNMKLQELHNKKVLILGTGNIASKIAERLVGFQVDITGFNRSGHLPKHFHRVITSLDILSDYDVIICTLPLTKDTHHFIDEAFLKKCKDGLLFINVARGSIVKEEALLQSLRENKFYAVILDVFEQEPLDKNSELYEYDQVLITPHNSFASMSNYKRLEEIIYQNIKDLL